MQPRSYLLTFISSIVLLTCAMLPMQQEPAGLWPDCATGEGNINNAVIAIAKDSVDLDLFAGALVGAFTEDGDCIGAEYWSGADNFALTIWGADADSPDPRGAEEGEAFELRVLNEVVPDVTTDAPLIFASDGIFRVRGGRWPGGSTSAELEQLQQEVDNLTAERDALVLQNATLVEQRDSLQTVASDLESTVSNLQTDVSNLTAERDQFQAQLADAQSTAAALQDRINTVVAILRSPL